MFDAVLTDLDGTLVDTETLAHHAHQRVLSAKGHQVSEEFLNSLIGLDGPASRALFKTHFPDLDVPAFVKEVSAEVQSAMVKGLALKPGALQLLQRLTVPAALVTSSGRAGAAFKLDVTGLAAYFQDIITRDDVSHAKPDPEPYLLAARRLGVDPRRCLAFEDSEVGAEAAMRAGCVVVQVPDMVASLGKWAHHLAPDLLTGAQMAGLILKP